jgi:hypothetical protein
LNTSRKRNLNVAISNSG